MNKVSVIVPTEGNLEWKHSSLQYTMAALRRQIGVDIELIVVASNPNSEFHSLAKNYDAHVIDTDSASCAHKRNCGVNASSCDYILFIDDDTVVIEIDAVCRACSVLEQYDFACGANRYWSSVYWHRYVSPLLSGDTNASILKNISILPKGISRAFGFRDLNEFTFIGNFGVVKKQVLRDCGMFDDAYKVYGFEDTDLMMRLCMNGCSSKLLCELPINVVHLTHSAMTEAPLVNNEAAFGDVQKNRGYYFQVNHFFGVYEGDGHAILVPCETLEAMLK